MSKIILDETSAVISGEDGKHKLVARAAGFSEVAPDGTETLISGTAAVTAHVAQGGAAHGAATPSAAGFMSATDKTKLNGIAAGATANDTDENLKNRANHTGEQPISSVTGLPGALNSKADLVDGKVAASQLPSYVDDVLEYADFASLPATGEAGKIYVLATPYTSGGVTSSQYRWSGTAYAPIIASPGSSDAVTEGATNLYFTAQRVRDTILTGLSTATGTVVNATHTFLQAIGFLQKQVTDLDANKANLSGADFTGPVSVISNIGVGSTNRTDLNGTGKGVITANAPGTGGGYHAQYDGDNVGYVIAAADALRINTFTGKTIKLGVEAIDRVEITSTGIQGAIGQDTPAAGSFNKVYVAGNNNLLSFQDSAGTERAGMRLDSSNVFNYGSYTAGHKWRVYDVEAMTLASSGNLILGGATDAGLRLQVSAPANTTIGARITSSGAATESLLEFKDPATTADYKVRFGSKGDAAIIYAGGSVGLTLDSNRNLLAGATSGSNHVIQAVGGAVSASRSLGINNGIGANVAYFWNTAVSVGENSANACLYVRKDSTTSRSINAAGTINASGADQAEYYKKAEGCGIIDKGQIVGVNALGEVTDKYADAVSFLIKSTDPYIVGGDVWGSEDALGMSRPVEPKFTPPSYSGAAHPGDAPVAPQAPAEGADEEALAAYAAALEAYEVAAAAYSSALSAYNLDRQAHAAAIEVAKQIFDTATYPTYLQEKATFEAALEAARQKVDRIAFSGQVPVNVLGAVPGQYIVPVQDGEGIKGIAVNDADITFEQYRRAVGVVQNILLDGRANVRVKAC
jgi:hypothetical protein